MKELFAMLSIALVMLLGTLLGIEFGYNKFAEDAIEVGVGQYNAKTAEFEFIQCREIR